jgi:glycosyltransferase involved in cell wall biosynthesis
MSQKTPNIKISAVIITLNEESNIARCLSSLTFVDEILIYDSNSKDKTVHVASNLGFIVDGKVKLKIVQGPWLGFGATKKKATSLASNDWVLSIDADEVISDELMSEISELFKTLNPQSAGLIPRRSFFLNRWIDFGGWYPDYQLRLFNRTHWSWDQVTIHEKVVPLQAESTRVRLNSPLHHFVFRSIEHQVATNNRYSTLLAQKLFAQGKKFNWFHFLTKPVVKFIECYIWKMGFRDGWPGFVIAKSASYSVFLKWAKLKELSQDDFQRKNLKPNE